MTLAQLKSSRALWRGREVYRLAKYKFYRDRSKRPRAEREELKAKWRKLWDEAKDMRVRRDHQIAASGARTVSDAGVALVAEFEGFRSWPYRDAVGVWTIGYGETKGVGPSTRPWSQGYAKKRLKKRLNDDFAPAVLAANKKLKQRELDGFTSFVYNVGPGGVAPNTTVGRRLRAGDIRGAADAILEWDKAGGQSLPGLTRRRKRERALILGG